MLTLGVQLPDRDEGLAAAGALTPARVLEACREQLHRVPSRERSTWRACRAIEALYHPARYIRVAYVLSSEDLPPSRFWSQGQIIYLHAPLRPPPSRRGHLIHFDGGAMEAYLFPDDRRLRGLRKFAGHAFAQETYGQWIQDAAAGDAASTRVRRGFIRYVPEQKLVVRLSGASLNRDEPAPSLAVRLALPKQAQALVLRHQELERHRSADNRYLYLPRFQGADLDRGIVATEWVEGASLLDKLRQGEPSHVLKRLARMLHEFHRLPMTEPARLTPQGIAARFNNAAALLASAIPRLGSPLEELRREFHARITALPVVAPVTLHNDFHWNQVRIRLRQYALLDMERTCLGDPLVDVANFAVEVRLLAQRSDVVVSVEDARRWSEAFCFQWVAATGRPIDPRRFHVYAAMAAVKLGAAMVRHLRPGWDPLAVNCVREAESHLQQLGAAVTEVTA